MSKKQTIAVFLTLALAGGWLVAPVQAAISENIERIADKMAPSDEAVIAVMDAGVKKKIKSDMSELETVMRESSSLAPSGAGLELNEISEPRDLLIDSEYLRKLLGTVPSFVYAPGETPDPMIVPWTRARVLTAELLALADRARTNSNWDLAEELYQRVLQIADSLDGVGLRVPSIDENRNRAEVGLKDVAMLQENEAPTFDMDKRKRHKLPPWVRSNTIGIVYHPIDPFCLVGTSVLRVGDTVPRQKVEVIVDKITTNTVHYRIYDQVFIVNLAEKETE